MRKLVVSEFVSIDGVMEAPGGEPGYPHTGWTFEYHGPEQERYKFEEVLEADCLLVGRVTYESFAGAWPTYEGEFADRMNAMPKYVVSTKLRDPEWNNTTVIDKDVAGAVATLKAQDGGPILVPGSRTLVQSLMRDGLVDEYRLQVFPVILGSGRRLYPDTPDKTVLQLTDSQTFPSGVVAQTYQPV
jgi:dihydrofolate reductase